MKLAIFSDIHGNLPALKAILDDIKTKEVDEVISLGDVVSIGPKPSECLDLIKKENITAVIGNHEVECLTNRHKQRKYDYSEYFDWQCNILSEENFEYMRSQQASIVRNGVIFQHFIIDGIIEEKYPDFCHVNEINEDAPSFVDLAKKVEKRNIFIGHEHHAVTKVYGDKNVFCIGSSGCVSDDNTFYKILDISNDGEILSIKNQNVKYNRQELLDGLNSIDYPNKKLFAEIFFGVKL